MLSLYCKRGHKKEGDNLYIHPNGTRECKACKRLSVDRYRRKNLKAVSGWQLNYQKKNPLKMSARRKIWRGITKGKIQRPEYCERCGKPTKTHAHHYDYTRAYNVLWLCHKCHYWLHYATVGQQLEKGY